MTDIIKKYFTCGIKKKVIAGIYIFLFLFLSIYTWLGEDIAIHELIITVLLILASGLVFTANIKPGRIACIVLYCFYPFISFWLLEGYSHNPFEIEMGIAFLNIVFFAVLYLVLFFITGSMKLGGMIGLCIPLIAGTANFFIVNFRSSPIFPWDLLSIGTAVSVADNYDFSVNYNFLVVIALFTLMFAAASKLDIHLKRAKLRIAASLLSIILMLGYVHLVQLDSTTENFGLDTTLYTPNYLYKTNGFTVSFLMNLQYLNVNKPEGYTVEEVERLAAEVEESESDIFTEPSVKASTASSNKYPNIIVIMNEAFSDLSVLGDFETSEEYMPFINSLTENTLKGELYVSVLGGNTANTEFEFLTGDSMAFLPSGSIPYQQYITDETPSLASQLKELGYITTAIHPYNSTGWKRNLVYPLLGFENIYFKKDMTNLETIRNYVSDRSTYNKIIDEYEKKSEDESIFVFDVTMQNHGSYFRESENWEPYIELLGYEDSAFSTENYLSLIKESDIAFEELVDYFSEQEEDTIILMFGDHQPADYVVRPIYALNSMDMDSLSLEEQQNRYIVPYVMWANFDIGTEELEYTSVNYLSTVLLETAGVPLTDYQKYLSSLMEELPVVTANIYIDSAGTYYTYDKEEYQTQLNEYSMLQYNHLFDTSNRLEAFFLDSVNYYDLSRLN